MLFKIKKRTIIFIFYLLAVLLVIPSVIVTVGFATPPQFSETYYAALGDMYTRLKNTDGKKIVIIGTSSVAFGVDSALMESELAFAGENYSVVNFGLYGALGTKVMLDLSEDQIKSEDIVIFAPEPHPQAMSLYFSAREMWYAADADFSLLKGLKNENISEMTGAFPSYTAKKFERLKTQPAQGSGIYARDSFDGRCDLKNFERAYNIMSGGYDANNTVELDCNDIDSGFIEYVNGYYGRIKKCGAQMYFSFAPVNETGLACSEEAIESYYEFISKNFDCEVISDPNKYIMEKEWFYDSNFHLNSAGMTLRTVNLLNDIKNALGITVPTVAEIPEKPSVPEKPSTGVGDNSFADCFEYGLDGDGYIITAMKASAKDKESITVPYSYNGKPVVAFRTGVFAGNANLRELVIQENINVLYNGSFDGCSRLNKLVLKNCDPSQIGVGQKLLHGADECKIYVSESAFGAYVSNYFWSFYAERLDILQ